MAVIHVGIDPGVHGAVAVINGKQAWVVDLPTITFQTGGKTKAGNKRKKTVLDAGALVTLLHDSAALGGESFDTRVVAWLEDTHSMPKDGKVAVEAFGRACGMIEGVMAAVGLAYTKVSPARWRPAMVGRGEGKEASRRRATQLFPTVSFTRVKDHNRAEALLIAEWGRQSYQKM